MRKMNVFNLLVTRQGIALDQIGDQKESTLARGSLDRPTRCLGGDANLLGTLRPMSACPHYIKGNQKKDRVGMEATCPNPQSFIKTFPQKLFSKI